MSKAKTKAKPTNVEFDLALDEIVNGMTSGELFSIPGVYEIVAEALNNEAIAKAIENRDDDT